MARFIKLDKQVYYHSTGSYEYYPILVNVDQVRIVEKESDSCALIWFASIDEYYTVKQSFEEVQALLNGTAEH